MPQYSIPYVNIPAQAEEQLADLLPIFESVVRRGAYIGTEEEVERLEARLAEFCDVKEVVTVNSGTDALYLAMKVAGIGPGHEVITPPNSFVASTATIVHVGATPVFVDVLSDQNIDPAAIERAVTPRTRAIMPVHLTGRVCRMDAILDIARKHRLIVIEDAAQAIGSAYQGRKSGSFGDFGCFSGHPLKNLNAIGDAGFITTNDRDAAVRLRRLRNHGMVDREIVGEWGFVSRLDVLQAAILNYRLDKLPEVIARRRANAALYQRLLNHRQIVVPPCRQDEYNTFHTFVVQVDRRDALQSYLREIGIRTAIHYPIPIHLQPAAGKLKYKKGDFPVTELQATRILTLPVNQYMADRDVETVATAILRFYA
jgi:dTDP-4-amino-4,6-dideoxygalactose transaminase